ncbi:MAG: Lrp/AsnC family transcriptional regulator [Nanoarchaeota archaeon]|nr:Lrp/AsnC family transcriptional regulator [Nanoarchaeota archaeon]
MKLDLTDRKLLATLDMHGRITVSQLAKKLRLGRDTVNYRLQRLIKEGIIKHFTTQIDATKLGYYVYKLFFRFQNVQKKEKDEIFDWLVKNKFVYWIAESRGRWDCNMSIFAKDIQHFDEIHSEFIDLFGKYILEQEFNITLEVGALQKNWKLQKQKRDLRKLYHEKSQTIILDDIDNKILNVIASNARLKTTEIASIINTSERIIKYHLKNLEKKKIILGYSISLDYEKIGKQFFKSIIELNVCSKELKNKIKEYCKSRPNIIYYIFCVGSWPLELEFAVENNKEYYEEMEKLKEAIPEIKGYETLIFPKEYKFEWIPK